MRVSSAELCDRFGEAFAHDLMLLVLQCASQGGNRSRVAYCDEGPAGSLAHLFGVVGQAALEERPHCWPTAQPCDGGSASVRPVPLSIRSDDLRERLFGKRVALGCRSQNRLYLVLKLGALVAIDLA